MSAGYQYVVLRCVPRVDREEFVNVGVILYCQTHDFLGAANRLDEPRLATLFPDLDQKAVRAALEAIEAVCRGDGSSGDVASKPLGVRFGFLTAPRSTVVQPGPIHGGVTEDPAAALTALLDHLVA
jgi:hypothetical protein